MRGETSRISDEHARVKFAQRIAQAGDYSAHVGEQLFDFSAALDSDARLERALTDPGRPPQDKQKLVNEILDGSPNLVNPLTREILIDVAARRWSKPAHIANAVEDLGVDCVLSAADKKGVTDVVAVELAQINSAVLNLPTVRQDLSDDKASSDTRVNFLRTILRGKTLNPLTMLLAEHAARDLRRRRFMATLSWLISRVSDHLNESVLTVTSAVPLTDAQVKRLIDVYSKKLNHLVHVHQLVDPRVMGGMRIQAGAMVRDNTVVAQLENLKRAVG
jgi:F-type H+-transporting ATPase subunit delta